MTARYDSWTIASLLFAAILCTGSAASAATPIPGDIFVEQTGLLMKVDPQTLERFDYPAGVLENCTTKGLVFAAGGELYVTSNPHSGCTITDPAVYRLNTDSGAETLVSSGGLLAGTVTGIAVTANGDAFVAVRSSGALEGSIVRVDPHDGSQALLSSAFLHPLGVAVDATGDLLVTDIGDNTLSRLSPSTGLKTVVAQGNWLQGLSQAGGIAVAFDGQIYVATTDINAEADTGVVIRVDPDTGVQTLVSYGQLLVAGNTGITGMAAETDGGLLVIDRRSPFGVIRIDVLSGEQTGLDIGASPIDAIALVPSPAQTYGLSGLLEPYAPPDVKQFKSGSTIPLKWLYTVDAVVFDSAAYAPSVTISGPVACNQSVAGEAVTVNVPGRSGLQYDALTRTWQFNWQTPKATEGCFHLVIDQSALHVTRTFSIRLRR
jgi:hypothetical protein